MLEAGGELRLQWTPLLHLLPVLLDCEQSRTWVHRSTHAAYGGERSSWEARRRVLSSSGANRDANPWRICETGPTGTVPAAAGTVHYHGGLLMRLKLIQDGPQQILAPGREGLGVAVPPFQDT